MNDYHLDPPDYPDPPECPFCDEGVAGSCEQSNGRITYICDMIECGHQWSVDDSYEPEMTQEEIDFLNEEPPLEDEPHCPHGNDWGDCASCDHLGDLAYDAARERRGR